ncbi:MAG: glycosyltransferase [Bdellovibrionales bacterium]|nr:glycosyltransferase [Bdellovibrionales bacterium]
MKKIALCILARNELPCLKVMYPLLPPPDGKSGYDSIYAIDGGSTDGTVEFFKEHGVKVLSQSKRGRGDAFLTAFREVEADAYIFFSPDGNENPEDLGRFRQLFDEGADLVIASRMMPDSVNEEDNQFFKWRKWANLAFNFLANTLFRKKGPYITDSINGYRGITKEAARELNLSAFDYTIEYQMTMRAMKKGLKIVEFPTIEGERIAGETGAQSIPTGMRFLRRLWSELVMGPNF